MGAGAGGCGLTCGPGALGEAAGREPSSCPKTPPYDSWRPYSEVPPTILGCCYPHSGWGPSRPVVPSLQPGRPVVREHQCPACHTQQRDWLTEVLRMQNLRTIKEKQEYSWLEPDDPGPSLGTTSPPQVPKGHKPPPPRSWPPPWLLGGGESREYVSHFSEGR